MKTILGLSLLLLLLQSCGNSSEKKTGKVPEAAIEKPSFFPVTDYIKGQIREIGEKQVNPIKYVISKGHTDSSWLKMEELPDAFSDFLHPQIDYLNLVQWFKESSFMDQSIDAFTFTYEAMGHLPDSLQLQHWDVYVDPPSGKVRRIYIVKNASNGKTRQLTWQGDKWCKIVDVITKPDGTSEVEKEINIRWDF